MKLTKRFEVLGDPTAFTIEFEREAHEVIAEADRRLASGPSTKALRQARERAERNGLGVVQLTSGGSALERWGSLATAVHWIEQLERQMDRGTTGPHRFDETVGGSAPESSTPETVMSLKALPGNVALEIDLPGHRGMVDLRPDDARAFAMDLIVASADAERMERAEPERLH